MSGYLSGLAWLVGPTERMQRYVLLSLADSADDKTGYCWPSVRNLANKTLFSTRYVIEAIQQLETDHWIHVEHRAIDGRFTAYTVDVERLELLRQMQREQEKRNRQSSLKVPMEAYLGDLRELHSQVNTVHARSGQASNSSREKGSLDEKSSSEHSSPDSSISGEIHDTTQVNSVAHSGEIRDSLNKEETSRNISETSRGKHAPSKAPRSSRSPSIGSDGELELAQELLRELKLSTGHADVKATAEQIAYEAPERGGTFEAFEFIKNRGLEAIARGEKVTMWWIKDRKFTEADVYANFSLGLDDDETE